MNKKYDPTKYFIFKIIKASDLISSQAYQRGVSPLRVQKIIKDFDPLKLDPIKVVYRDGKYYVYDGQHRLVAMIKMFGRECNVPCLLLRGLSVKEEAIMFANQDVGKQAVGFHDKLRAMYVAGDKEVCRFHDAVESTGFECDFVRSSGSNYGISAWRYLYNNVFVRSGESRLKEILSLVINAWGTKGENTSQYIVQGLNFFLDYYEDVYDKARMIRAMKKTTPKEITAIGRNDMLREGAAKYAGAFLLTYNDGKRSSKLPVRF